MERGPDGFTRAEQGTATGRTVLGAGLSLLSPFNLPAGENIAATDLQPVYFPDLNLDQFADAVTAGREDYDLRPFFYQPLRDEDEIRYRQEVFKDLDHDTARSRLSAFARAMKDVRVRLRQAKALRYRHQAGTWFVDAAETYCDAVASVAGQLEGLSLRSQGMNRFRAYFTQYAASEAFARLNSDYRSLREALAEVNYCINIRGARVTVARYDGELDYGAEVLATFARFQRGTAKDYLARFREPVEMNRVEANILSLVARLYPAEFSMLDEFCAAHAELIEPTVDRFDRELQFYLGYLEHIAPLRARGLSFCYPVVATRPQEVFARDSFDVVLARKLADEGGNVVCNDFWLRGAEQVLVVSGPNQGGKTTFARMFGQVHHLASIGCPVPGTAAQLGLFDEIYAHFERTERVGTGAGKLEEDLLRARHVLSGATAESVIVLNELFSSTTLHDARFLGTKVMERLIELGSRAVYVTFVEELASYGPATVSMVSTVLAEDPAQRTFRVVRQPADGLAYALALSQKYGLTYQVLRERLSS